MPPRRNSDKEQNQWLMITQDSTLISEGPTENKPTFCRFRHPKSDDGAQFLLTHGDTRVNEVLSFQEDHRSWFISQNVHSDGSLYMTTPVDPLFLILPYIIKAQQSGKFQTLDQMVTDDEFAECRRLCSCVQPDQLTHIADHKGTDEFRAYRYNKEKTISWLKLKVERLANVLEKKKVHVTGRSHAEIYVSATSAAKDDYLRYAQGMVADYLPVELGQELKQLLGIASPVKEKPEVEGPKSKKVKVEGSGPLEDYSNLQTQSNTDDKKGKMTVAQTKLSKVDKAGMKSIASFFSPKTKAKK